MVQNSQFKELRLSMASGGLGYRLQVKGNRSGSTSSLVLLLVVCRRVIQSCVHCQAWKLHYPPPIDSKCRRLNRFAGSCGHYFFDVCGCSCVSLDNQAEERTCRRHCSCGTTLCAPACASSEAPREKMIFFKSRSSANDLSVCSSMWVGRPAFMHNTSKYLLRSL